MTDDLDDRCICGQLVAVPHRECMALVDACPTCGGTGGVWAHEVLSECPNCGSSDDDSSDSWAYTRDASWFNHPQQDRRVVYHMESEPGSGVAACRPEQCPLSDNSAWRAERVPVSQRCRRPACRAKYERADNERR